MKLDSKSLPLIIFMFLFGFSGDRATEAPAVSTVISAEEQQSIARDAYDYGFPLMMNLKTFYEYAVDVDSPNFKAPLNEIWCEA